MVFTHHGSRSFSEETTDVLLLDWSHLLLARLLPLWREMWEKPCSARRIRLFRMWGGWEMMGISCREHSWDDTWICKGIITVISRDIIRISLGY